MPTEVQEEVLQAAPRGEFTVRFERYVWDWGYFAGFDVEGREWRLARGQSVETSCCGREVETAWVCGDGRIACCAHVHLPEGTPGRHLDDPEDEEIVVVQAPARKGGRPKGSKNKRTLERERLAALLPPPPPKKRGRPKGSKNKPKV